MNVTNMIRYVVLVAIRLNIVSILFKGMINHPYMSSRNYYQSMMNDRFHLPSFKCVNTTHKHILFWIRISHK